jgi:hypothetical protein
VVEVTWYGARQWVGFSVEDHAPERGVLDELDELPAEGAVHLEVARPPAEKAAESTPKTGVRATFRRG